MTTRKQKPGVFTVFKGLWSRGHVDNVPSDHFSDCLNTAYVNAGVCTRTGIRPYLTNTEVVRMHLYKPNPPFTGTNVPRIIALRQDGTLIDLIRGVELHKNPIWKDFALVNFFGRCYISPHDGKVGIENESVWVYDGTNFRLAAGDVPTAAMVANANVVADPDAKLEIGDYVMSYAFETASGFITQPWATFIKVSSFGGFKVQVTTLPLGPAGTTARWIIMSKVIPFNTMGGVGNPQLPGNAHLLPLFLALRVGDNTTAAVTFTQYDNDLIDSADSLFSSRTTIPAGVGLLDYKGRMVCYGPFFSPSLAMVSGIGEPENFSATSGFLITEPSDNTGIRSATEFRDILYLFKRQRGGMTQDNGLEASTWQFTNFEKAQGTEQYGIAAVLDAKGSSSDGYILCSLGAILYFNGTFVEPELSYKIRDLWHRINQTFFHLTQCAVDYTNRQLYILIPLDGSQTLSHLIVGDFRDGLDPFNIKWSLWQFPFNPTSILIYTDFSNNNPQIVVRISYASKIVSLQIDDECNDDGTAINSFFELPPVRFSDGMSLFNEMKVRVTGPCTLDFILYGMDKKESFIPESIVIDDETPGGEFAPLLNLVNEHARLRVSSTMINDSYHLNSIIIKGQPYWSTRPR